MTHTIRGRVYRRMADVRAVTDPPGPVLIPAGWSTDIAIDGINRYGRDGMPTHAYALQTCLNVIRGFKVGVITAHVEAQNGPLT